MKHSTLSHGNVNVKKHLNKGKLHLNDKGISSFVRNFRDFLNVFETDWDESNHDLFDVSCSSFLSGCLLRIKQQRIEHAKNIIICHLNINSIRNNFNTLDHIVKALDIFLIWESKLDNTFPTNQFSTRACLKNGQHLTQKKLMRSPFKNWCFWFPCILNF